MLADHLPVSLPVQQRVITLSSLLGARTAADPSIHRPQEAL
jgi:hypothetical protein